MPDSSSTLPAPALSSLPVRWAKSPYVLLTLTVLFWSGNVVAGRLARDVAPPITLTLLRWVIALAILTPFAWRHWLRDRAALLRGWKPILILSVFGIAAFNCFGYTGMHYTTAINAGLLQSAMSPMILLWAFLFFRERPSLLQFLGIAISMAGVVLIVAHGSLQVLMNLRLNPGDGLVLIGLAAYAIYSVFLRQRPPVHPLSLLATTFALGALILVPFSAWEVASGQRIQTGLTAALVIGYVSIFPSLIAYMFFNRGVELIGSARAGQFVHLVPVFVAAIAVTFLGETLHLFHVIGAAIIFLGIFVSSRGKAASA